MRAISLVAVVLLATACGAPDPEQTAYVSVHEDARAAGVALLVDGAVVLPRGLPIAVPAAVPIEIRRHSRDRLRLERELELEPDTTIRALRRLAEVELAPGEAAVVLDADGSVTSGVPAPHAVQASTDATTASELAAVIGASALPLGLDEWRLEGPDALLRISLLEERDIEGVRAIEPVFASGNAVDAARERRQLELSNAAEAALIATDLKLEISQLDRERMIVTLTNQSDGPRAVVQTGDGSEVGWREPHIETIVERQEPDGTWARVRRAGFGRCGMYDTDWQKDATWLAPGSSLKLGHVLHPRNVSMPAGATHHRVRVRYAYGAGQTTRAGEMARLLGVPRQPVPAMLQGVPPFEVVSEPVTLEIE